MKKSLLWLVTLMLVATFSLFGCKAAPEVVEPEEEPAVVEEEVVAEEKVVEEEVSTEPVTITWWHIDTQEGEKELWQQKADEYMADHPNVTIEITVLDNENFKAKMTTVMQTGEPPDLFQSWGGGVMNEYAKAGLLKDITADLDKDGWRDTFPTGALGLYSFEGKNYGVPRDIGMVGFWYNKELFAQAGIDNPPATWTELLEDVQKLKDAGITPIALGAGDKWPAMFYWAYLATRIGGRAGFEAAYSRTGSFTDAPFVEAGEKILELVALDPFQSGFLGASADADASNLMGNGKAGMDLMGQWAPAVQAGQSASGEGIGDNLGWFPFPIVEGGAGDPADAVGGGDGFAVGINAPQEAVDFLKYISSVDCQIAQARIRMSVPVVKGAEEGLMDDPLLKIVQQGVTAAKYFQLYYDQALPPAVASVVNDSVQGIFAGTLTPLQAAQAIEDSAAQELK